MRTYSVLTLQQVIDALRAIPGDPLIKGMSQSTQSYRGYYDRASVEPVNYTVRASVLADDLASDIGKPMTGYKGGEFTVDGDLPLYIANYGDTGPAVCGFEPVEDATGVYEPVGIDTRYY